MGNAQYFTTYEASINRHWCPESEAYTGADALLTAQQRGWQITRYSVDTSHCCVTQKVTIYVFTLQKVGETINMQVVANPFVEKLVKQLSSKPEDQRELKSTA